MYLEWGNLDKAEIYLKSALAEMKKHNMVVMYFTIYRFLGTLYFKKGAFNKALEYYREGNKYSIGYLNQAQKLVSCAAVFLELNSMDSAYSYLESAETLRQQQQLGIISPQIDFELDFIFYKYYSKTGNNQAALKSLKAGLQAARSSKVIPLVIKYTRELHVFLLKQGDSLQSLPYLVQYHAMLDSMDKSNTQARIATFEIEQQQLQKESEIELLQTQKTSQRHYYLIGGIILMLIVLAILSRLRYKRKRDKEQLTTDFKNQLAQAETKALRAQMNPHFIFNSLNSINSFVMDQQHVLASEYLIKFSKLIRLILDNSRSETISIEKELETLKLYVLLEAARFDNKFKCVYHIAGDVNTSSIMIPPMLLQPFVENAIWHGLMQKEGEGTITIDMAMKNEELLMITIEDDGIGREKAAELKSKSATHKSHGLKVTSQRIEMMNKLNSSGAQVTIVDLKDEPGLAAGTRVVLVIPI
jgi:tetratricopeptide (TPR) repeat protein